MSSENFLSDSDFDRKSYAREALMMNVTEDILVAMENKGVTKTELARLLHKSKSFVTQTLSGSRNMTLKTLADIAFNLDLTVSIAFEDKTKFLEKAAFRTRTQIENYEGNSEFKHFVKPYSLTESVALASSGEILKVGVRSAFTKRRHDVGAVIVNDNSYRSAKDIAQAEAA
ncbi:MAG: helix-turn-helix domain-containing protein [Methylobacter sp.]